MELRSKKLSLEMRPNLVIFDCDGVLVDSETPMHEELHKELRDRGLDMSFDTCLANFVGKSIESVIQTAKDLGADLPANWKAVLYERVYERLKQGVDIIPGIPELVQRLIEEDVPFCVASNGSETKMELMLSQHGLWEVFKENCFSAQTIGVAKPDPGLLRHALVSMGTQAKRSVVIEDSPIGIQSAANASVPCLVFAPKESNLTRDMSLELSFQTMPEIGEFIFTLTPAQAG